MDPKFYKALWSGALAVVLPLAACDSGLGPEESGQFTVNIAEQSSGSAAYAALGAFTSQQVAAAGNVSLDDVSSIDVTVDRVEVLRIAGDNGANGQGTAGWVSVGVEGGTVDVDLLNLGSGVTLASGELEAGEYRNARLFFESATITFSNDVTLGSGPGAETFEAGTPHDLFIASGTETGIKVPTASFTVDEGQTNVTVLVDTDASVQSLNVTGNGILMSPVLTAQAGGSANAGG